MKFKGKATLIKGELVRISKSKGIFEKGYLPNWSEELFEIANAVKSNPAKHFLKDLMGKRRFLRARVAESSKTKQLLDRKIIKTRRRKGTKAYFVKWFGYPETFDTWVTENDRFLPLSS